MKNPKFKFIFAAYGIFWGLLALTGVCMLFGMSQTNMKIASTICAWAPTFAILIMFNKLNTGYDSRRSFIKSRFRGTAWVKPALVLFAVQAVFFFDASYLVCCFYKIPYGSFLQMSPSIFAVSFVSTALGGALGEELGWRGYLFWEQKKERGVIKGSVFNGIVWTLWHIPLWFIRGGSKWELLVYIIAFTVVAISVSVTMGVFINKTKNLITSILIHFSLNFWLCFVGPQIPVCIIMAAISVPYLLLAVISVIYQRKKKIK